MHYNPVSSLFGQLFSKFMDKFFDEPAATITHAKHQSQLKQEYFDMTNIACGQAIKIEPLDVNWDTYVERRYHSPRIIVREDRQFKEATQLHINKFGTLFNTKILSGDPDSSKLFSYEHPVVSMVNQILLGSTEENQLSRINTGDNIFYKLAAFIVGMGMQRFNTKADLESKHDIKLYGIMTASQNDGSDSLTLMISVDGSLSEISMQNIHGYNLQVVLDIDPNGIQHNISRFDMTYISHVSGAHDLYNGLDSLDLSDHSINLTTYEFQAEF